MRTHSGKSCLFAAILIFCTAFPGGLSVALCAQDSNETVHGFTVDQRFQGSSSSFGQIFKLNTNLMKQARPIPKDSRTMVSTWRPSMYRKTSEFLWKTSAQK